MVAHTRCGHYVAAISLVGLLTGALSANALTQEDFNSLVSQQKCTQSGGCQPVVDEALRQNASLRDIARMAQDAKVNAYQDCILAGVATRARLQGMSPLATVRIFQGVDGLDETQWLTAMARSGVSAQEINSAAQETGILESKVGTAFARVKTGDVCSKEDALAYTPLEESAEPGVIVGIPLPWQRRGYLEPLRYLPREEGVLPYSSPSQFGDALGYSDDDALAYTTPSTFEEDDTLPYTPEEDQVLPYSSPSKFDEDSE